MPFNSRNSNNSGSRSSARSGGNGGGRRTTKAAPAKKRQGDFNMMSFGVGFFDEDGKYPKVRILLKKADSNKGITDEQDNQYTREEAATLIAEALLAGRGISLYLFENDDGTMSGNARIDVNGLGVDVDPEAPEPELTQKRSVKPATKRTYPAIEVDEDEEIDEEVELPY